MSSTYADWRGHVIVCGLPGVGLRIVELLNLSGVPAVGRALSRIAVSVLDVAGLSAPSIAEACLRGVGQPGQRLRGRGADQ
ncbi:MAG TPA: hypothetical protein VMV92_02020 [Streptosporangiaceae bacterium]|nr:hypothetical protein [Streptosporangiaceae bacterium]